MARPTQEQVEAEIALLGGLSLEALKARWLELKGIPLPKFMRRGLMTKAVAHALRESSFSGLDPATQKKLEQAIRQIVPSGQKPPPAPNKIKAATRVIRRSRPMRKPELRCAIYTRKSSEEGLEQDFNSLHAQREACEAYIKSQKHEGWRTLPAAYDDGGFSGGSMERPGLQKLLAEIAAGQIDVVVVYKVDRLTRALMDFAKIVEVFDRQGVSFVSVTQA
jgi:hypothetical protein